MPLGFSFFFTPPEATNTGPGFNRGSGGDAQGCGFEERAGAYARTEGGSLPIAHDVCLSVCTQTRPNRLHTHTHPPKRLAHPRSPMPPLSTLTSRATHAHPTSPRSTGFCVIRNCISSSSSSMCVCVSVATKVLKWQLVFLNRNQTHTFSRPISNTPNTRMPPPRCP